LQLVQMRREMRSIINLPYVIELPEKESEIKNSLERKLSQYEECVGKFRVSLAGQCFQKRVWVKQGIPFSNPSSPKTMRVFEVGKILHEYLQNFLDEQGLLVLKEFELEDAKRIGHLDAVIWDGKQSILYDFKTVSSSKFPYLTGVSIFHVFQVVTYYEMLKSVLDFEVDSVRIIYISKDDLDMKEYEIDTKQWHEAVHRDWFELYEFENGALKNFPRFPWECVNCVYRDLCIENMQK